MEFDPSKIKKLSVADNTLLFCDGVKFDCAATFNYWRWNFLDYGFEGRLYNYIEMALLEDDDLNTKK
jgi:hypothetical protein